MERHCVHFEAAISVLMSCTCHHGMSPRSSVVRKAESKTVLWRDGYQARERPKERPQTTGPRFCTVQKRKVANTRDDVVIDYLRPY